MEITDETIKHIASLAKIELDEKEIPVFVRQFSEILAAFDVVKEADIKEMRPSFQPVKGPPVLREDIPKKGLTVEQANANVEYKKDNYVKGPRVL